MAALTIRNIDDIVKAELRVRAAKHGRSMEEEARRILAQAIGAAVTEPKDSALGTRLHAHFAGLGDVDLPPRRAVRDVPRFGDTKAKHK